MTWWGIGISAAGSLANTYFQSQNAKSAANSAANAQIDSAQAGIGEQQREFDAIQQMLAPFVSGGTSAFGAQGNLIGLGGPQAEQSAINDIQNGPQFQALNKVGQNAILQNASATGNLRGGNVQAALAQFSPQLLSSLINQRFSQLGGLTNAGVAAGSAQANAGQHASDQITQLLAAQGAAGAGNALAAGKANSGLISNILGDVTGGIGGFVTGALGF